MAKIILASGSPQRRQLMELAGITCEIMESGADEAASGTSHSQACEIAMRKAQAVKERVQGDAFIIAADTLVVIDGRILGKPKDAAEAFDMLNALQGRKHTVITGVALIKKIGKAEQDINFADTTDVYFRSLNQSEIKSYIATDEPFNKAGAYGIQGQGALLVERIEGDFYTVVGLPLSRLYTALLDMGYGFEAKK